MSNFQELFGELAEILRSLHCPLIVRSDSWWIEEILFKPGKPRTDLLIWTIMTTTSNSSYGQDLPNSNSTMNSTASFSSRLPENDEEILELLCNAGVCSRKDMPFVQGSLNSEQQLKFWDCLIRPLQFLANPSLNTDILFSYGTIDGVVSKDNFYDLFTMTPNLLPSDVKSELERFAKENVPREDIVVQPVKPSMYDEEYVGKLTESSARLKKAAEKFITMFNLELKHDLPPRDPNRKVLEFGDEVTIITDKCSQLRKNFDTLQDIQRRSADIISRKAEILLENTLKLQSYPPFKNLCEDRNFDAQ